MKKIFYVLLGGIFLVLQSCYHSPLQNGGLYNDKETLLKLIDKRLSVSPLVAKSKWNTKAPIDDPIREKIILDSVGVKAKKLGIDEGFAIAFFQAQFEAGKKVQRQFHNQWLAENKGPFNPSPNLANEVRPILDSLTPYLLMELKKLNPIPVTKDH
jgi:chorismate mutase, putative